MLKREGGGEGGGAMGSSVLNVREGVHAWSVGLAVLSLMRK